jgi:hypothetical protein
MDDESGGIGFAAGVIASVGGKDPGEVYIELSPSGT